MTAAETRAAMVQDALVDAYEWHLEANKDDTRYGRMDCVHAYEWHRETRMYRARQYAAREIQAIAEKFLREPQGKK